MIDHLFSFRIFSLSKKEEGKKRSSFFLYFLIYSVYETKAWYLPLSFRLFSFVMNLFEEEGSEILVRSAKR
jgi:hypothetical protein